ncbi:hypothetical protein VNO77_34519 [Canavalia gladiata]|uniref:Uncharacterized protein n=1 Tax=Canavalia gladiata TaxID=3824 RepID=A0AAN9KGW0_CANGL
MPMQRIQNESGGYAVLPRCNHFIEFIVPIRANGTKDRKAQRTHHLNPEKGIHATNYASAETSCRERSFEPMGLHTFSALTHMMTQRHSFPAFSRAPVAQGMPCCSPSRQFSSWLFGLCFVSIDPDHHVRRSHVPEWLSPGANSAANASHDPGGAASTPSTFVVVYAPGSIITGHGGKKGLNIHTAVYSLVKSHFACTGMVMSWSK